jgi:hypothetical protein
MARKFDPNGKSFFDGLMSGPSDDEIREEKERKRKEKLDRWAREEYTAGESVFFGLGSIIGDKLAEKLYPFDETIMRAERQADLLQKIANIIQTTNNAEQAIRILEAEKLKQETRRVRAQADVEEANADFTIDELRRLKEGK